MTRGILYTLCKANKTGVDFLQQSPVYLCDTRKSVESSVMNLKLTWACLTATTANCFSIWKDKTSRNNAGKAYLYRIGHIFMVLSLVGVKLVYRQDRHPCGFRLQMISDLSVYARQNGPTNHQI